MIRTVRIVSVVDLVGLNPDCWRLVIAYVVCGFLHWLLLYELCGKCTVLIVWRKNMGVLQFYGFSLGIRQFCFYRIRANVCLIVRNVHFVYYCYALMVDVRKDSQRTCHHMGCVTSTSQQPFDLELTFGIFYFFDGRYLNRRTIRRRMSQLLYRYLSVVDIIPECSGYNTLV